MNHSSPIFITSVVIGFVLAGAGTYYVVRPHTPRIVLTRDDLPQGLARVTHHHPALLTEEGEPRAEMEHWAAPEAVKSGGPIYGVYGYRIVAIEYELPVSDIGERPVGEKDTGMLLRNDLLSIGRPITYDHVHVGLAADADNHSADPRYIIHYMLIPHEEEMKIGLSCS